ncbi:MAG: hypothetical protein OEY51_09270, partial [Cyclobacteriaceae bacterium]|nr:hypothetical protein [Cyclobacteriaceae bacterium]
MVTILKTLFNWLFSQIRLFSLAGLFTFSLTTQGQHSTAEKEARYYTINKVPIPKGIVLEVGGMVFDEKGRLAVCTR